MSKLKVNTLESVGGVDDVVVPYTPAGVGAVATTVQSKLRETASTVSTIADLRNETNLTIGPVANVAGYYAVGDGGGGPLRVWNTGAPGTYTDDGGSIIVPTGEDGSGAWVWEYSGAVNVKWFGAKGDGVADDTAAIQAAIGDLVNYNHIVFVDGIYNVSSTLNITHRPFDLSGNGVIKYQDVTTACIEITAAIDQPFMLRDITIEGPYTESTHSVNSNAIRISGVPATVTNDGVIDNVTIRGFGDNGIRLSYCDNYLISNCKISMIGRTGLQIRSSKKTVVRGNTIKNIFPGAGGVAPFLNAYGMSFTQANADTQVCEDCIAESNVVDGVISWTGIDTHGGQRLIIRDNTVLNTMLGIVLMGPGGGSTTTVSADNCEVTGNTVKRISAIAPYSRAGILVSPSSSGVSLAAATRHRISGNYIENHGSLTAAEGALTIANTVNAYCCDNEVISSIGYGIHMYQSSDFTIVGGDVSNNNIKNVVANNVGTSPTFLALIPSSNSVAFTLLVNDNTLLRTSGNGIGIYVGPRPVGAAVIFGPLLGNNRLSGFDQSNALRLLHEPSVYNRISTGSLSATLPLFVSEVTAAGVMLSGVRGLASISKLGVGEYRCNFRTTNINPVSVDEYNVVVSATGGVIALPTIAKALTYIDVKFYNLAAALIDTPFTIQVSRNLLPDA